MKKWLLLFSLLVSIYLLPKLVLLDSYISQAEHQASDALGVPVKIAHASIVLLPRPQLLVYGVKFGATDEVRADRLSLVPDFGTLFSAQKAMRVVVDRVQVKASALQMFQKIQAKFAGRDSDAAFPVRVENVRIEQLDISDLIGLPMTRLEVGMASNAFQQLLLESLDQSFVLHLVPLNNVQSIHIKLHDFLVPGRKFKVDNGTIQAKLEANILQISQLELHLLGGRLDGNGEIAWQSQAKAHGKFQLQGISMQALTHVGRGAYLSGRLSGAGTVGAQATKPADLLDHLWMDANLEVKDGILHGVDLVKIAQYLLKQREQGGETVFDTLRTQLKLQDKRARFHQLALESGLLTANGDVEVLEGQRLHGDVSVAIKSTAGLLEVPLDISGTMNAPSVLPNKAAAVGALVGTAFMPGVGTSLGIKAGKQLNKLFGDD